MNLDSIFSIIKRFWAPVIIILFFLLKPVFSPVFNLIKQCIKHSEDKDRYITSDDTEEKKETKTKRVDKEDNKIHFFGVRW